MAALVKGVVEVLYVLDSPHAVSSPDNVEWVDVEEGSGACASRSHFSR
jgi:hypothetical protein